MDSPRDDVVEREETQGGTDKQLPHVLQQQILSLLPPNERALSARFVCRDARDGFKEDCTASLSQPLPPHAAPWAQEAGQQHLRQLPFNQKLRLLYTAAASGSEFNLEVVWSLLQPSVFPELLHSGYYAAYPGEAAARAGHPHLLGWLRRHCPALLHTSAVLQAAARHCDLAGLQAAWEALQGGWTVLPAVLDVRVVYAAAESATPDAVAKMEWLLEESKSGKDCRTGWAAYATAGESGDLGLLRWLRDRGCSLGGSTDAVCWALRSAPLPVAQWLVDEEGCRLPAPGAGGSAWASYILAAARSADGAAKLAWLQGWGAPPLNALYRDDLQDLLSHAVKAGHLDVLRCLLSVAAPDGLFGDQSARVKLVEAAARYGSIAMAECLRDAGLEFTSTAYKAACTRGNLAMVRWLARDEGVSAAGVRVRDLGNMIAVWPCGRGPVCRGLLEAVQLLVGAGYSDWNIANTDAKRVVSLAAERGDLALVQYLLQHMPRLQPDGKTLAAAATAGCEVLLEWLVAQHPSCLSVREGDSPYLRAAKKADRGTLAALRRLGVPWGARDVVVRAKREWCGVPVLRWLVEQGAPVGSRAEMERVLGKDDDGVAAWLRSLACTPPGAGSG